MRYSKDPRWITARYGRCEKCGAELKGKNALYFPIGRHVYCEKCGEPLWREFQSEKADEAVYNGCGNPY